jgi:hypothetical protein
MVKDYAYILLSSITTSVMLFSFLLGNGLAFLLFYLTPLPIILIGIHYNWRYSLISSLITFFLIFLFNKNLALFFCISIAIPSIYLSYLTMLSKKFNETIEWYPVSLIFSKIIIISSILCIFGVFYFGTDINTFQANIEITLDNMLELRPDMQNNLNNNSITYLIKIVAPIIWIASKILDYSKQLKRPWPTLRLLNLPPYYIYAYIILLIGAILSSGIFQIIFISLTAALTFAYTIIGLSVIHTITIGISIRPLILAAMYTLIMFFLIVIIPIAIIGILDFNFKIRNKYFKSIG